MIFAADALAIFVGGIFGSVLKNKINKNVISSFFKMTGMASLVLGITGIIEQGIFVSDNRLISCNLTPTLICMLLGTAAGEYLNIEKRLYSIKIHKKADKGASFTNALIYGIIFFSVGALQIIGPLNYVLSGSGSELITKAVVDFPFALSLGAYLGFGISASCFFVLVLQLILGALAVCFNRFFTANLISSFSTAGYIILMCLGINIVFKDQTEFKTVNMLPSFMLIFMYDFFTQIIRR